MESNLREDTLKQLAIATRILREDTDPSPSLSPMLVLVDAKGAHTLVSMPNAPRELVPRIIKMLAKQSAAERVYYMDEAWLATVDKDDPTAYTVPHSERESRIEVVLCVVSDRYLGMGSAQQPIDRDDNGKPVFKQEPYFTEGGQSHFFRGLWDEAPISPKRLN